jgi:hypothetical protein
VDGKALSEMLALKPERGKPAFRNFREGDGNGGIIRSPLRAIALPDNRKRTASLDLSPYLFTFSVFRASEYITE